MWLNKAIILVAVSIIFPISGVSAEKENKIEIPPEKGIEIEMGRRWTSTEWASAMALQAESFYSRKEKDFTRFVVNDAGLKEKSAEKFLNKLLEISPEFKETEDYKYIKKSSGGN